MNAKRLIPMLAVFLISSQAAVRTYGETFTIAPDQSAVTFRIKAPVGKVKGKFEKFSGQFVYDPAHPEAWHVEADIEIASIHTGIGRRDKDVQKPDFLDAKTYPTMHFVSTAVAQRPDGVNELSGLLTLHGVTQPVMLRIETLSEVATAPGPRKIHAVASTQLARKDFGVGEHHGNFMAGKSVEIRLDIVGVQTPA